TSAEAVFAAEKLLNIKQVQVSDRDRVDILFDGRLSASQIQTEFVNDIVQLSLSDTAVYPAKISSVSGKDVTKLFVYQYSPRLVRVRLTMKGKAESFQSKLKVTPSGKMLTIRFDGEHSDQVVASAAQAQKAEMPAKDKDQASSPVVDPEEGALLEKVLKSPPAKPAAVKATDSSESKTSGEAIPSKKEKKKSESSTSLGGKKDSFSPLKMLASLAGVILVLGASLLGLKKITGAKAQQGAVGRWVRKSLGKPEKMIEVVSTHHLGPKKSIHMVRVAGRTLVLGVAEDSINLITELDSGGAARSAESAASIQASPRGQSQDDDFLSALGEQIAQESGRSASSGTGATAAGPAIYSGPRSGARERIRSRVEGMKPL
ncbi:MAG: hypothetical protein RJB38_1514, partial [Pseudomonadota bacterium]